MPRLSPSRAPRGRHVVATPPGGVVVARTGPHLGDPCAGLRKRRRQPYGMRLLCCSYWVVPCVVLLGFGCSGAASSSVPRPSDGASGSTSGNAGQTNSVSGSAAASGTGGGLAGSSSVAAGVAGSAGAARAGAGGAGKSRSGGSAASGAAGSGGRAGSTGSGVGGASSGNGGASGSAGSSGTGGTGGAQTGTPPGDIASAAGTPLVAAHSVTRALYAAYSGKLFTARRASDAKTQDINTASAGGFIDLSALQAFCSGTTCSVSRLYDQAGNGNDMSQNTVANQPSVGLLDRGEWDPISDGRVQGLSVAEKPHPGQKHTDRLSASNRVLRRARRQCRQGLGHQWLLLRLRQHGEPHRG